jgi:excisionase family DNA binding protein
MMTPSEIDSLADQVAERVVARLAGMPSEAFIDVHKAAELLGCSVPTVERRTADGSIPSHKFGRLRRYLPSELLGIKKGGAA